MPQSSGGPSVPERFHIPAQRKIIIAQERKSHGKPGTGHPRLSGSTSNTNPPTAIKEPPTDITINPQRAVIDNVEAFGVASGIIGRDLATRYSEVVVSFPWRMHGLGVWALFGLLGSASTGAADLVHAYTPPTAPTDAGSKQWRHYGRGGVKGTRCPSYTLWIDLGDGTWQMIPFATITQLRITWNPAAQLMGEVTFNGYHPIRPGDAVSPTPFVEPPKSPDKLDLIGTGVDGLRHHDRLAPMRTLSQQASRAAWFNHSGNRYAVPVQSGELIISRPVEVIYAGNYRPLNHKGVTSNDALAPFDFIPGDLAMTGTAVVAFDTAKNGGIYDDFLNFTRSGDQDHVNKFRFTDGNTNWMQVEFWPSKFDAATPDNTGTQVKLATSFTAYNDLSKAIHGTHPYLTLMRPKVVNFSRLLYVY